MRVPRPQSYVRGHARWCGRVDRGADNRPCATTIIATCIVPWLITCTAPLDGPGNMALDVALMARARRTGDTVIRVYGWSSPTLSFGRNQRTAGAFHASTIASAGVGVVRRPTGGRALLHHREITYSVTAPATAPLPATYAHINALVVNALGRLGVPVTVAPRTTPALAPGATPCFAEPAAGELVVDGRKLVGSAQWRDAGALLQHGSILLDDDQRRIDALTSASPVEVPPPATLRAILGRVPGLDEMAACLLAAAQALADPGARAFEVERPVLDEAYRLSERYRSDEWTWRR